MGGWLKKGSTDSCFHLFQLITTLQPTHPQKMLSSFFSSHSHPNPSLLHCICFLIQSVWEAHGPLPPHAHPPHHFPFSHWSRCCNLLLFDFLLAPFCLFSPQQQCTCTCPNALTVISGVAVLHTPIFCDKTFEINLCGTPLGAAKIAIIKHKKK